MTSRRSGGEATRSRSPAPRDRGTSTEEPDSEPEPDATKEVLWSAERVAMDRAVRRYVGGNRVRLHDALYAVVEQAVALMTPADDDTNATTEVLGTLWAACVMGDAALLKRLREPALKQLSQVADPSLAPVNAEHRTRGGYQPEQGDDMIRHIALLVGVHLATSARAAKSLEQVIADSVPKDLDGQVDLATSWLLHPRLGWLPGAERSVVEEEVRQRLKVWVGEERHETEDDRRSRGTELLRELLVKLGVPRKKARNIVHASEDMRAKRGKKR